MATLTLQSPARTLSPLDTLIVAASEPGTLVALDGASREYFRAPVSAAGVTVTVGGALGTHTLRLLSPSGAVLADASVGVNAVSEVSDTGGRFAKLFDACRRTMFRFDEGVHATSAEVPGSSTLVYHGTTYRCYVWWILDHCHTAKGMQYFPPTAPGTGNVTDATASFVDLLARVQRDNGMIFSNVFRAGGPDSNNDYFHSAYGPYGFSIVDGNCNFNRQPVENHNEYNFVETVHLAWKASGDDDWMKAKLDACLKALNYSITDPLRYSARFGLLKRGYCIDSWDFQVHDKYTVKFYLATAQQISAETKFGVFFGDNHGYALACDLLAEMLTAAGRETDAAALRHRARGVHARTDQLTWIPDGKWGGYYRHRVEEDDTVLRDLGVDEKSQVAMSNAYALNRGISHEHAVAILKMYQNLKADGAPESPGEWYAIYPPFGTGFGKDSDKYQYMNAGVHGHAAGELARGAFEHGFETYGADILLRLADLSDKHPKRFISFAYTGGWDPEPPPPAFVSVNLNAHVNMHTSSTGDRKTGPIVDWMLSDQGNDLAEAPKGDVTLAAVPWSIPAGGVVAVSKRSPLPASVSIPVSATARAVYLLHTAAGVGASGVAASLTFVYADGTEKTQYLQSGKHITGFWYPSLKGPNAGVAFKAPNAKTTGVGATWCALPNPHPDKPLAALRFSASEEGATYALLALNLADRLPYRRAPLISHGGPDNWSAGTTLYALMEGLAGIKDTATRFDTVRLSPRWTATGTEHVRVAARYNASHAYLAYTQTSTPTTLRLTLTGSGHAATLRLLLPPNTKPLTLTVSGTNHPFSLEHVESSTYLVPTRPIPLTTPTSLDVTLAPAHR